MATSNSTQGVILEANPSYIKGSLYLTAAVLIAFENAMVVVSFKLRQKKKRGVPDALILSLALSSLITSVLVAGVAAYVRFSASEAKHFGSMLCKLQYFCGTSSRLTDLATTTMMSIDRLVALWKPFFYRRKIKFVHGLCACIVIWLGSSAVASLPFFGIGMIKSASESVCALDWNQPLALALSFNVYAQFVIVFICYIAIVRCISKFVQRQSAMEKSRSMSTVSTPSFLTSQPIVTIDRVLSELDRSESCYIHGSLSGASDFTQKDDYSPGSFANETFLSSHASHLPRILEQESPDSFQLSVQKFVSFDNINFKARLKVERTEIGSFDSKISKVKSSESLDLRIKAEMNSSASWDSRSRQTRNSRRSSTTLKVPPQTRRFSFPLSKGRNEELPPSAERRESQGVGILRQWSLMVRDKWRERKILRQSHLRRFWQESKYFAKVLGVVVIICYFSSLPLAVTANMVYMMGEQIWSKDLLWICYHATFISCLAIPIAYALLCKPYREAYVKLLNLIRCRCGVDDNTSRVRRSSSAVPPT